ncbi:helix-turn-helix transcriptional regulator [Actinospica robiniae]|uniref:helix-turn-helix transcriptional regulator n=1 Tax=Actinospica robiniae TaxID=304901 RepID=UPI000406918B|nr:helix-turn-helix transcriptional regulator [Actinospica robiniae]
MESVEPAEGRPRITPAAGILIAEVAARVAELARTIRELERLVELPSSSALDEAADAAGPPADARDEQGEFELFARESNLTGREAEVLRHLLEGHSNRRISRSLHISESTVKNHLHAIFVKLDTRDRTQLIAKVYRFMAEHSVRGGPTERPRVPMQAPAARLRPVDEPSV